MDPADVVGDVCSRQNHTIFARRGCGKTLLLHYSTKQLTDSDIRTVYLNCEDFKHHSFPNVLIEILDALFRELERHLHGWFGRSKRAKALIQNIRSQLSELKSKDDSREETVKATNLAESGRKTGGRRRG